MDYQTYVKIQTVTALSHEEESRKWSEGQRIFVRRISTHFKKSDQILDCACGDGVGLEELRSLGYDAIGVDLSETKLDRARKKGLNVFHADMHDLSIFSEHQFDIIMCSHTLEHAYDPDKVIEKFRSILKNDGFLFVVLPFPDLMNNIDVHVAKDILGTSDPKNGENKIQSFFNKNGFEIFEKHFDSFREPEIWLSLKKISLGEDE